MSDLISRQALKNSLTNWQMEYAEKGKDVERFETIGAVIELVGRLPTIDPVKRGKWINDKGLYRCSVCNNLWTDWWAVVVPEERMYKEMKYCPTCGAKMERSEYGQQATQ